MSRVPGRLPWILLAVTVALVVAGVPLSLGQEELADTVLYSILALAFGTTGALVASRQPGNPIGWIFCGFGVWQGVVETWGAFAYHSLPTGDAAEWVLSWGWILDLSGFALVFLIFPAGRLMSGRWRIVIWLLLAGCILALPGQGLNPDNTEFVDGSNPLAVDAVWVQIIFYRGLMMVIAGLTAAVVALVIRYRRAVGIERLQLKQFVFAGSLIIPIILIARIQETVDRRFLRHKYDAARTLEAFSARLRDEVDLEALAGELRGVVAETMQPAHVSLWVRRPETSR